MSFVYTRSKRDLAQGTLDFREAGNDIRVLIVMTNTTADTEEDAATLSAFTTLDEMDGTGYVRKALASQTVTEDTTNNRAEFDATDVTWTTLGAGTRSMAGLVIYDEGGGTDATRIPIAYIDTGGFPIAATGVDFIAQWNAEGILQVT